MKLSYGLYMAEQEGYFRKNVIEEVIVDFIDYARRGWDINRRDLQEYILNQHDLSLNSLSIREKELIMESVSKKCI